MWKNLIFIVVLASGSLAETQSDIQKFQEGVKEFVQNGQTTKLIESSKAIDLKHLFREKNGVQVKDEAICGICATVVDTFIELRRSGVDKSVFVETLSDFCGLINIEPYRVCHGVIELNADTIIYIVDNKPDLNGKRFCASVLQKYQCSAEGEYNWDVEIPEGYSAKRDKPTENAGQFHIAQVSDFHYDPLYTPGKSSQCTEPLCCQADQEDVGEGSETCGYWSSYNLADIPLHTVEEVLNHVSKHEVSYIYYTGDIISHRVWSTSIEDNTRDIKLIYGKFKELFDIPVYPILGNHEPSPLNIFSINVSDSSNVTTSWLYNLVADEWSDWIPEEAQETIRQGGFYTVVPRPGFRVVVLNSNVCYNVNWWLVWDDVDPYGQLAWLVKVLSEAEKNDESVHILTHIPSGSDSCLTVWGKNFNKIITRFANTITGIFTGHTHKDEWQVYYNQSNPGQPVNVAFNGASVTPYSDSNPSYKMIHVNNETFSINNICEWTFNLTAANTNPDVSPEWYELYSFKGAYGVPSLEAEDVDDLLYRMAANQTLIKQFDNFRYRNSDVVNSRECDEACLKDILCLVSVTTYGDNTKCEELKKIWDDTFV